MSADSLQLLQQVAVKVVMTPDFRAQIVAEVGVSLGQIEGNLARLEEIAPAVAGDEFESARVRGELERLRHAKDQLQWRIREAESLNDGAELFYQNLTSLVTLKVGDDFQAAQNREIVVKDGKVVAIRTAVE